MAIPRSFIAALSTSALICAAVSLAWAAPAPRNQGATPKAAPPLLFKVFTPAPTLQYFPTAATNMAGWTKVTAGATNGNPSLLRTLNGVFLVGRGGDNAIYGAPVNIANPQAINPSSWQVLAGPFDSGIACNAGEPSDWQNQIKWSRCYGLGAGGSAAEVEFPFAPGGNIGDGTIRNIGGQNAGGLPMGIHFALQFPNVRTVSVVTVVADSGIWLRKTAVTGFSNLNTPITETNWQKVPYQAAGSAAACINGDLHEIFCAYRSVNNFVRLLALKGAPNNPAPDMLSNPASWINANIINSPTATPAIAQPLTSAPSIIKHPNMRYSIMIRDFDGSLKRIVYNAINKSWGAWSDEGGYLATGSQPSCIADGAVPVCLIQGPDGAGYIKRLPAATAGL